MTENPTSLPLRMLHDRLLVLLDKDAAERRSASGIVIPATAQIGKRLAWAQVVAAGPNVRQVGAGDRVLFDPEDRSEVEVGAREYILLRERDVHAVAQPEDPDRHGPLPLGRAHPRASARSAPAEGPPVPPVGLEPTPQGF